MTDTELIAHYGGPAKLARLLGFPEQGGVQRIQNWTTRGIPPAVKVQFPELFLNPSPVASIKSEHVHPADAREAA